ncbi:MAG: exodeoxyribonuclease III [Cellvibrionaceae bacterium]
MKVVSFNINGVRARPHQMQAIIETLQPDVIGLQETKVHDEEFPLETLQALGYEVHYHGQKSHYGVAILSKLPITRVQKGFALDTEDTQKRLIAIDVTDNNGETVTIFNGYFPQGESQDHPEKFPNKRKFYADLSELLKSDYQPDQNIIVMGDINISPIDLDIGIGEDNKKRWLRTGKCSFLPEEREWLQKLKDWGLTDTFREQNPEIDDRFSWFDYRSKGFDREPKRGLRIDVVMATKPLVDKLKATGIDYDIRAMEKPSDHCPVWAEFN